MGIKNRYIRSAAVSGSLLNDGIVLYNPDNQKEKYLNETAFLIWTQLNGKNSLEQLPSLIRKEYTDIPDGNLNSDIQGLIHELESLGFLRESETGEEIPPPRYPHLTDGPDSFDLSLTGKCNLACQYCFYADEMNVRPDLPKEQWFRFFDELGRLSVRDVTLSGGGFFLPDILL